MSVPTSIMQMYTGANRGGVGGYGSALTGGGRLASSLGGMYGSSGLGSLGNTLGNAGGALGLVGGLQRGGVQGYGTAAMDAAKLYGNLAGNSAVSGVGSDLGSALGMYGGIKQGGVAGDTQAAAAGTQLASAGANAAGYGSTAAGQALSAAASYAPLVGEALGMYQAVSTPAVTLSPQYYGRINDILSKGPGDRNNPADATQYGNYWSTVNGLQTQGDPLEQKMLSAYGLAPTAHIATSNTQPWQITSAAGQKNSPVARSANKVAKGGPVKDKRLHKRLRKLYKGSFAARKRNYDDGGGVGYFTPDLPTSTYDPTIDYGGSIASQYSAPTPDYSSFALPNSSQQDLQSAIQQNMPSTGYDASGNSFNVNENVAPYSGLLQTSPTDALTSGNVNIPGLNNSALGSGGALSGLGSALGASSLGQLIQKYGALAPLLSGLLGQNKPASAPSTPQGYANIAPIATPTNQRAYTQPNVQNWYTYGQGPEQSFFSNNQLPTIPGMSPASAGGGASAGTMNTQPVTGPRPVMQARGGPTFDSTQGDSYVGDPGHGDGTSDGIDAKLSGGEYVMDAGTVSTLGNGSNEAGARALDQLRQRIRKHAGKSLSKGKQFMKAKPAESYLKGSGGE